MTGRHLVLIGLMGAGKTTVGLECASRLERAFVDTDDLVTSLANMSIEAIFADAGEPVFRQLEHDVVTDVCASPMPLVIACGGGTVVDPDSRRALRAAGVVIWLRAPTATLLSRVGDDPKRPLLRDDPEGALERLGRLRELTYEAAAHASVDTGDLDVAGVAAAVLAAFEEAAS
jgi:shikimate kinase